MYLLTIICERFVCVSAGLCVANFEVWARFATAEGRRKKLVNVKIGKLMLKIDGKLIIW